MADESFKLATVRAMGLSLGKLHEIATSSQFYNLARLLKAAHEETEKIQRENLTHAVH